MTLRERGRYQIMRQRDTQGEKAGLYALEYHIMSDSKIHNLPNILEQSCEVYFLELIISVVPLISIAAFFSSHIQR